MKGISVYLCNITYRLHVGENISEQQFRREQLGQPLVFPTAEVAVRADMNHILELIDKQRNPHQAAHNMGEITTTSSYTHTRMSM